MPASTISEADDQRDREADREQVQRRRGAAHHAEREVDDQQRGDAGQRDRIAPENSCAPQITSDHSPPCRDRWCRSGSV